jgi:hypothetical protein
VVFSYYEDRATWLEDTEETTLVLGPSRGVTVDKLEPLAYRVSYGKKSVVFALNDLSQVKPPAAALAPGDQFIGPVFDETAIRFFLVFNTKLKLFHYILDDTVKPADGARVAVTPYMEYRSPKDLAIFDRCATSRRVPAERYAARFALALEGSHGANARLLSMQHHAR